MSWSAEAERPIIGPTTARRKSRSLEPGGLRHEAEALGFLMATRAAPTGCSRAPCTRSRRSAGERSREDHSSSGPMASRAGGESGEESRSACPTSVHGEEHHDRDGYSGRPGRRGKSVRPSSGHVRLGQEGHRQGKQKGRRAATTRAQRPDHSEAAHGDEQAEEGQPRGLPRARGSSSALRQLDREVGASTKGSHEMPTMAPPPPGARG